MEIMGMSVCDAFAVGSFNGDIHMNSNKWILQSHLFKGKAPTSVVPLENPFVRPTV